MTLTAQQEEARRGRYTSTRAVRLYRGEQVAVYAELLGLAPEVEETSRMRAGRKLQRAIVEWAAEERGWNNVTHDPPTYVSETEPLFASSPDALGLAGADRIIIEAKNRAGARTHEYDDGPLEDEIVQWTWHAGVTGLHRGAIVVLLGGNDLRIYDQEFDAETFALLADMCLRFHREHVVPQTPPPMDASRAAADFLRARFPREVGPLLQANDAWFTLAADLKAARAASAEAEEKKKAVENAVKLALGDAAGVEGPFGTIRWQWQKGGRVEAFDRAPTRVLRAKWTEED